jgi:hypothetical protein
LQIHNATFAAELPPTVLAQARDLANYHENAVFSSATKGGVQQGSMSHVFPRYESLSDTLGGFLQWLSLAWFLGCPRRSMEQPLETLYCTAKRNDYLSPLFVAEVAMISTNLALSYKPFISFFNLTGLSTTTPSLGGLGPLHLFCSRPEGERVILTMYFFFS